MAKMAREAGFQQGTVIQPMGSRVSSQRSMAGAKKTVGPISVRREAYDPKEWSLSPGSGAGRQTGSGKVHGSRRAEPEGPEAALLRRLCEQGANKKIPGTWSWSRKGKRNWFAPHRTNCLKPEVQAASRKPSRVLLRVAGMDASSR